MKILLSTVTLLLTTRAVYNACVSSDISEDQKLQLNADANDHDGSGKITTSDIEYDLSNNYDTNNDGQVTEAEWISHWTCAYGDTDYFARYVFAGVAKGELSVKNDAFNFPPLNTTGIPREAFIQNNRHRYDAFSHAGCVNSDITVDQKLDLIVQDNDRDNNGLVTVADFAEDSKYFDTNDDGEVTKQEFVTRWVCRYGDDIGMAIYMWDVQGNGSDVMVLSQFAYPPFNTTGMPLDEFRAAYSNWYEQYRTSGGQPVVG